MTRPPTAGLQFGPGKRKAGTGVFVLAALAAILAITYLAHAGEPARIARDIKIKEGKLQDVKKYIGKNYDALVGKKEKVRKQDATQDKPLLTVIKETAQRVGLTSHLSSVTPEENKKLRETTARVVIRRIRLADLVNFLVYVRSNYPGVMDREGRLRLAPRQQADSWDAFISLTVRRP